MENTNMHVSVVYGTGKVGSEPGTTYNLRGDV